MRQVLIPLALPFGARDFEKTTLYWLVATVFVLLCWGVMLVAVFAQCGPVENLLHLGTLSSDHTACEVVDGQ